MTNLKKEHPQKYYLKLICNSLFYLGLGSYWYERNDIKDRFAYKIWAVIINGYTICVILNQMLAFLRADLTPDERSDLAIFGFGQILVIGKFLVMYRQQNLISKVIEVLLEKDRNVFRSPDLDRASIRKAKLFCYPFITASLSGMTALTIDVIKNAIIKGAPAQIVPTYYPDPSASGLFTHIVRFFLLIHYWIYIFIMCLCECLCIYCLVFMGYNFLNVLLYFESRREALVKNKKNKTQQECEDQYEKDIILGIKMHENALWCASNFQSAMGIIFGIQMCECIYLLAVALLELVNGDRTLANISVNLICFGCLMLLTACYMIPSGDLTYHAAQIPTAIFHSGWERVRARRRLRALLVVAIMRAQRPVHMTAFGVLDLSYESYILVLRSSYSFFAVMY